MRDCTAPLEYFAISALKATQSFVKSEVGIEKYEGNSILIGIHKAKNLLEKVAAIVLQKFVIGLVPIFGWSCDNCGFLLQIVSIARIIVTSGWQRLNLLYKNPAAVIWLLGIYLCHRCAPTCFSKLRGSSTVTPLRRFTILAISTKLFTNGHRIAGLQVMCLKHKTCISRLAQMRLANRGNL